MTHRTCEAAGVIVSVQGLQDLHDIHNSVSAVWREVYDKDHMSLFHF